MRWQVLARGVGVKVDMSAKYPDDLLLASGFQVVDEVDSRAEAARVRDHYQAKGCLVELREVPITAETITDAQIRELRNTKRSVAHWNLCDSAIRNQSAWDRIARARCAEILNARTVMP